VKKPFPYNILSDEKCGAKGCARFLKKNLVLRKRRRPLICYAHWLLKNSANAAKRPV